MKQSVMIKRPQWMHMKCYGPQCKTYLKNSPIYALAYEANTGNIWIYTQIWVEVKSTRTSILRIDQIGQIRRRWHPVCQLSPSTSRSPFYFFLDLMLSAFAKILVESPGMQWKPWRRRISIPDMPSKPDTRKTPQLGSDDLVPFDHVAAGQ